MATLTQTISRLGPALVWALAAPASAQDGSARWGERFASVPIARDHGHGHAHDVEVGVTRLHVDAARLTTEHGEVGLREVVGEAELVALHFWASWCAPCVAELPALHAYMRSDRYRAGVETDLVVIPISADYDLPTARNFLRRQFGDESIDLYFDLRSELVQSIDSHFSLPVTYLFNNRTGSLVDYFHEIEWSEAEMSKIIRDAQARVAESN